MASIADWLDNRTGYRKLLSAALDEEVVGGARWAYVFGSGLLAIFSFQVLTGLLLMATYAPTVSSAWSSVFYIQHKVAGGWFVRGLHAYGAQAMVVVLGMHLLQVAIYGAYKKPREVTWWFGLALLGVVQGLALTGYLLPWDQKGYWATKVATNIAGTVPLIGGAVQALVVGGSEYGQATLTRFYVLHVGVLPATLVLLVTGHLYLFRRNGATPPAGADLKRVEPFYPNQVFKDVAFAVLILAVMAILTSISHGGHLDAPADPSADYPPRPEWYFLFLFELLKYLPGSMELVGTIILPGLAMTFLFLLPFLDKGESKRVGDRLPWIAPLLVGGLGIVVLTWMSMSADANDADFQAARAKAHERAERAIALAKGGIPPGGPLEMLRNDPMSYGADLYEQHCQTCHILDGQGERSAPDHDGFGSRAWITGLLHDPQAKKYFGTTEIDEMKPMDELGEEKIKAVTEFLFSLGHEKGDPPHDGALATQGREVFENECMDCHILGDEGADMFDGPNMTGYGSSAWIRGQIKDPGSEAQYGDMNEMPSFSDDLTDHDIEMITAFLRRQRFAQK
ncbi:MAG: cytochrome b N-terminal domain-containing protein [Myxococcales bacterium]|nr:cytochrome b N-terminal domain-containing protein [Myxococcales bacterium]MDD9964854.1 cytochrome b N-terminal domain-containing protein [Myxococcales bacterium]